MKKLKLEKFNKTISDCGEPSIKINYRVQPIYNSFLNIAYGYECLSSLTSFIDENPLNTEDFFNSADSDLLKEILISQINEFSESNLYCNTLISFNAKISFLLDKDFVSDLISLNFKKIALEITSFDISNYFTFEMITILESIHRLKSAGVSFWFDDFYHSENEHLFWFDFIDWDVIKLDMKYLLNDEDIGNIPKIKQELDKRSLITILEGVETEKEYFLAKSSGLMVQGYYVDGLFNA